MFERRAGLSSLMLLVFGKRMGVGREGRGCGANSCKFYFNAIPLFGICCLLFSELRSCVKVEVAILGSPTLTVLMVSVNVKQH